MRPVRVLLCAAPLLIAAGCFGPVDADPKKDPCEGVTCGGNGTCVQNGTQAQCICNNNYEPQGLTCVAKDACAGNPCQSSDKVCQVGANNTAVCSCPAGFVEQGNGCVKKAVCTQTSCPVLHQGVCHVDTASNTAVCDCDLGYLPSTNGCVPDPVLDCALSHSGGAADDSYEPNECPRDATSLTATTAAEADQPLQLTLAPTGDVDWFAVTATRPGNVVKLTFTGATTPLYVDVFAHDAVTPLAANHSGSQNPLVAFQAPSSESVYVRVKALSGSATTSYTATAYDLGADDFANNAQDALSLSPSAGTPVIFFGELQFEGDLDVLRIASQPNHSYQVALTAASTGSGVQVEVLNADGTLRKTLDKTLTTNQSAMVWSGAQGSFLLRAKAESPGILGSFYLTVTDLGVDDHGDVTIDAAPITAGASPLTAQFERAQDTDVYSFAVTQGRIYRLTCTPLATSYYGCVVVLRDEAGTVVAQTSSSYPTAGPITAEASATGTWTASVQSYTTSTTGSYTVKLEDLGADDHGDTAATATAISVGTPTSGQIEVSADHDFFSFSGTAGHIYKVGCTSSASYLCAMTIRDSNNVQLGSTSYGASTQVQINAAAAGTFTVDVFAYSSYTGSYTITVTDLGADDHGDSAAAATALTTGSPTSGSIQFSGDHDFFSFTGTAGHIYKVGCTSSSSYLCVLNVRDGSGVSVGSSSYGTSTQVNFNAVGTGTFTVDASGYSSYTGSYTLTVTDLGTDDHGDSATTATALTLGTPTSGNLQFTSDHDFFSFSAQANHIYLVNCTTSASYLCAMQVRDMNGVSMGTSSYGTNTQVRFRATLSGTYSVDTYSSYSGTGVYSMTVTDTGADDHGDTAATATAITVGATQTAGNIQFNGDHDFMSFSASANTIYSVSCQTSASYLCVMTVRDSSGTTVASSSYGPSTSASFKAATSGTYTIDVAAYSTGYTGAYGINILTATDDHGDTAATGTTLTAGGASMSGNIQFNGDKDVFVFTGAANHIYRFTCTSVNYGCATTVRDAAGTTVWSGGSSTSSAIWVASSAQQYSVELRSYYTNYLGGITVQLFDDGVDDHGNTAATGTAITVGGSALSGNLQYSGDKDVFTFTAGAGRIYRFSCSTSVSYGCYLVARDQNGTQVATASYGSSTTASFKATSNSQYSVEVSQYYSGYTGGPFTVSLVEVVDDFGDTYQTAGTLPLSTNVSAMLEVPGDVDFFQASLAAGTSYTLTATQSGQYFNITIYDSTGTTAIGTTAYNTRTFTTTAAGTYYFKIAGYYSTTQGAYTVRLQ